MADVQITAEAQEQFQGLRVVIRLRIEKLFVRLRDWPSVSGAKPLRGNLAGCYRLRTGDYRVQFRVAGELETVEKVGHRDGFYGE